MGHSHSITESPGQLAGVAALSAAIGAATAMLVAPKSGNEMRQAIRARASDMRSKLRDSKEDISEAAANAKETATKAKEDIKDSAEKKIAKK